MGFNAVLAAAGGARNYMARRQVDKRVSLLCHFDGNLTDLSTWSTNITSSTPSFSDSGISSFGKRIKCMTGGASFYIPHADFSGSFSIEFQMGGVHAPIDPQYFIQIGQIQFKKGTEGHDATGFAINGSMLVYSPITTASHYQITRSVDNVLRFFVNGVLKYSTSNQTDFSPTTQVCTVASGSANCWLDELRIVSGAAVHTSNFTLPTAPFTGFEPLGA